MIAMCITYLVSGQLLSLVVSILLLQIFDTFSFLDLEGLELLSVVHSLVNSLIDSDKLLVVLHDLQLGCGLDLGSFNCAVKLTVECLHLLFVLNLQVLDLLESLLFILLEALIPSVVEVLHVLLTDLNILTHLSMLNVGPQLVLSRDNFGLKESHFLHQVLVQLVLVDLAALIGEQLHFLLHNLEDHDLLILVEHAITTLIEHLNELSRGV